MWYYGTSMPINVSKLKLNPPPPPKFCEKIDRKQDIVYNLPYLHIVSSDLWPTNLPSLQIVTSFNS